MVIRLVEIGGDELNFVNGVEIDVRDDGIGLDSNKTESLKG